MVAKKRRRLPEPEDLEATVADILNSPITRANLSFLRPISTETESQADSLDTKPGGVDSTPAGVDLNTTHGLRNRPIEQQVIDPGFGLKPVGLEQTPVSTTPTSKTLWRAEAIGTVFEQTRVRRIVQAQDALSLVEERVYDLLWGTKDLVRQDFRLVHYSLQRISTEARINIKTVRELIPRLIEKGFIEIQDRADPKGNRATLYKVWSYSGVLARQKARRRFYVVKTGKGVFYVHPVSAQLEDTEIPMGFTSSPRDLTPMGDSPDPSGLYSDPNGLQPIRPMGAGSLKPMGGSGPLSLDISIDTVNRQTTTTLPAGLIELVRQYFGSEPDTAILTAMLQDCQEAAIRTDGIPPSEEELLYFARAKARVLSQSPNIRNHMAVLRKALPQCFCGEAFRVFRAARGELREPVDQHEPADPHGEDVETKMRHAHWTRISERYRSQSGLYDLLAIAQDPELDSQGQTVARARLAKGRFSTAGL